VHLVLQGNNGGPPTARQLHSGTTDRLLHRVRHRL
jgi:hypothetical protein